MIGDFGQEQTAVYPNGGYVKNIPDIWGYTPPTEWGDEGRETRGSSKIILKMNGDRPSFVREGDLLLGQPAETNPNTVLVYLGTPNGIVLMSNNLEQYFISAEEIRSDREAAAAAKKKGGTLHIKRNNQTKKRQTRNRRRTRKMSARKTRR